MFLQSLPLALLGPRLRGGTGIQQIFFSDYKAVSNIYYGYRSALVFLHKELGDGGCGWQPIFGDREIYGAFRVNVVSSGGVTIQEG